MINIETDKKILETYSNFLALEDKRIEKRFNLDNNVDFRTKIAVIVNKKQRYSSTASIYDYDYPDYNKVNKYIMSFYFYDHSFLGKILSFDIETHYLNTKQDVYDERHIVLLSDREFNEAYIKTRLAYLKIRNKRNIDDTLDTIREMFKDHNNIVNTVDDLH